jgi:hypothetical protein
MKSSRAIAALAGASFIAIVAILASGFGRFASATDEPRLDINSETWTSSAGVCTARIARASVSGVPADVKARIDGLLASALTSRLPSSQSTPAEREAQCAKALSENAPYQKVHPYQQTEADDWTTGFSHGRWLSARLHVTQYSGGAHPSDNYVSMTFDLAHAGYPVPKSGFYLDAQRARFNQALFKYYVANVTSFDPQHPPDASDLKYMSETTRALDLDETHILLTSAGIEINGIENAEAARNEIVKVPFSALNGIGTPGGPLDPATR